jgi:hypothetical protein
MPPRPGEVVHRAKVFADVCEERDPEYSDYEKLQIQWGEQDNYEVSRQPGGACPQSQRCVRRVIRLQQS